MKKDELDKMFEGLRGNLDLEEPNTGHQERFLKKLNQQKGIAQLQKKKRSWFWPLSIAASVVLLIGLGLSQPWAADDIQSQVVEIAPEASKTQFYFASLVEEQVLQLENERTPETSKLVDDTLLQLKKLDVDYQKLERDLIAGGNKEILLNAMINNFQTRIDLLKEVLANMETIKNLKTQNDENYII